MTIYVDFWLFDILKMLLRSFYELVRRSSAELCQLCKYEYPELSFWCGSAPNIAFGADPVGVSDFLQSVS